VSVASCAPSCRGGHRGCPNVTHHRPPHLSLAHVRHNGLIIIVTANTIKDLYELQYDISGKVVWERDVPIAFIRLPKVRTGGGMLLPHSTTLNHMLPFSATHLSLFHSPSFPSHHSQDRGDRATIDSDGESRATRQTRSSFGSGQVGRVHRC
jgi:hypothetical protein